MKKTALLLIVLLGLLACKKQSSEPITDYSGQHKSGKVKVTINSNYKYPYVSIQVGGAIHKRMNFAGKSDSTEIVYEFNSYPGEWWIYTTASKNGSDSTKDMKDGNIIWESLKVEVGGQTIHFSADTIKPNTTEHGVDNEFVFKVY